MTASTASAITTPDKRGRNRRPLKWTASEPEGWHVYTWTADCECGIDAIRFGTNHWQMSNSAGYYETFEDYVGMQNEAAQMIDDDAYHQFGWTLPDGTVMQEACPLRADADSDCAGEKSVSVGSRNLSCELTEIVRPDGDVYFWQLADAERSDVFGSEFAEADRVMAVRSEVRGRPETWIIAYQRLSYDSRGVWDGWARTSAADKSSAPSHADSYEAARLAAAAWLAANDYDGDMSDKETAL